jgi:hypothetical protein
MLAAWGQKSWNADGRFAWVISADKNGEAIGLVLLITNGMPKFTLELHRPHGGVA